MVCSAHRSVAALWCLPVICVPPVGRSAKTGGISVKVLIAGESWTVHSIHQKGFDSFTTTEYAEGVHWLRAALEAAGWQVVYQPSHVAARDFPSTAAELGTYDCVILSDIGANTLLLHPDTFVRSKVLPNRLHAIRDYVAAGGGFRDDRRLPDLPGDRRQRKICRLCRRGSLARRAVLPRRSGGVPRRRHSRRNGRRPSNRRWSQRGVAAPARLQPRDGEGQVQHSWPR